MIHIESLRKRNPVETELISNYLRIRDNSLNSRSIRRQFAAELALDEPFDKKAVAEKVRELSHLMRDPRLLYASAVSFIEQKLEGRTNHLSEEELYDLAAYLVAWSYLQYANFDGTVKNRYYVPQADHLYENYAIIPRFEKEQAVEIISVGFPDLHYAGVSPRRSLYDVDWRRGSNMYPRFGYQSARGIVESRLGGSSLVRVLDIGHGDGWFLGEMQKAFGDELLLYGATMQNMICPNADIFDTHFGPGEVLPRAWEGKMDIIFSNAAMVYFMLPHRGIEEAVRALAPGGEAHLAMAALPQMPDRKFQLVFEYLRALPLGSYKSYVTRHFEALEGERKEEVALTAGEKYGYRLQTSTQANMLHIFRTA